MRGPGKGDYCALAATSASNGMGLLIPLYLAHAGHPAGLIGLVTGISAVAALLSRIPLPLLYRPERSRALLLAMSAVGAASSAVLPFLPDLVSLTGAVIINRIASGIATAVYLARYLDLIGENPERRRLMGYYGGTQAAGYASSNLFTGLIADFAGFTAAFLFSAAASGLAAVILMGLGNPSGHGPAHGHAGAADGGAGGRGRIRGWLHGVNDPGLWRVLNVNNWNNFFHVINATFFPVLATTIGLPPAQVGLIRALYAGTNAVSRPIAGLVLGRLALRQVAYIGIGLQAALLFAMPMVRDIIIFVPLTLAYGLGRAIVVVASSAGLAEDVDHTRVSRGVATATYSTSADIPNVGAPFIGGLIASVFGVLTMFPVTAVGFFTCFVAGDFVVDRWRARRAARVVGQPAGASAASGEA